MEAVLQTNTITAEINISLALAEAKKKIEEYQLFSKLGDECAQGWKDISDLVVEVKTQLPALHDIKNQQGLLAQTERCQTCLTDLQKILNPK